MWAYCFLYGVWGTILCLLMSIFLQNSLNCSETNSRPLLVLKTFNFVPSRFPTRVCHSLNFWKASDLFFKTYSHTLLEKSSMMVRKYELPPWVFTLDGPHKSSCTYLKGLDETWTNHQYKYYWCNACGSF